MKGGERRRRRAVVLYLANVLREDLAVLVDRLDAQRAQNRAQMTLERLQDRLLDLADLFAFKAKNITVKQKQ